MEENILNAVQTLGISVVMCLLMAWFVKYMFDKFISLLEEEKKAHKEEVTTLKDALNNNTVALTKVAERMGEEVLHSECNSN